MIAMITRMDPAALIRLQFNAGDILILLGFNGLFALCDQPEENPRVLLSPSAALFMIIVTGCVIVLPFYVIETLVYKPVPISANAIYAIAALSLVSTVFGTLMWNLGKPAYRAEPGQHVHQPDSRLCGSHGNPVPE